MFDISNDLDQLILCVDMSSSPELANAHERKNSRK